LKKNTSFAGKLTYTFISIQFPSIALFNSKEVKEINKYSTYNLQYYLYTFLEIINIVIFLQSTHWVFFINRQGLFFTIHLLQKTSLYCKWVCTKIHFKRTKILNTHHVHLIKSDQIIFLFLRSKKKKTKNRKYGKKFIMCT